jgi:hypothetical protein
MVHSPEYRRVLHKIGYYSYQNGLIFRHLNQDGGWDEHNLKCRSYIMNALDHFRPEKVTILGSGWLLDIPLAEIAERTASVTLVDIVHPPEVREQVSVYGNVHIKEADVTGGLITEVWAKTHKSIFNRLKNISEIDIPDYIPEEDPGLVISLNILTQLENLPMEYLRKKTSLRPDELLSLCSNIQKKHVEFLQRNNSVLISDVEEIITENSGNVRTVPTLRVDITGGGMKDEWIWDFDLKGSDYYNSRSVLKVKAYIFES